MTFSVLDSTDRRDFLSKKIFFDGTPGIARYEKQKYPWIDKLTQKQLSFFWIPEEVDLSQDFKDWKTLTHHEQHIFVSNLKRQILLDSVQGRSPSLAFLPIVSLPEMETWIQSWAFSETIHSKSYTHILRNIYSNPSEIFDSIMDIQEVVNCSEDISIYYNELINYNNDAALNGYKDRGLNFLRLHKRALWLTLMSVNVLEGLRFYASFACSWAFAENKKMEGNAKIIKFICKDENLHLAGTQQLLRTLPEDDEDFKEIEKETSDMCYHIFDSAIKQEKEWAKFIFQSGSIIGLNEQLLREYIDFISAKRMTALGLNPSRVISNIPSQNPLPWTQKWIAGSEVQVAPQETQITSYVLGGINKDVTEETFKDITL